MRFFWQKASAELGPLAQMLTDQRETLEHRHVLNQRTTAGKVKELVIMLVAFALIAWFAWFVFRVTMSIMEAFRSAFSMNNVKISRTGASVKVNSIPQENYVDICRSKLYKTWLNSSAPSWQSKYWQPTEDTTSRKWSHDRYKKHRIRRGRNWYNDESASAASESE
ncbi:uncharacterized protein V1510DRAFT_233900 [Dipodascopsis tothii]|uniref:uncharacterized protein n=1 Tax=Dipodascopsis tothii TaxID=44089 RepID=UPI0034CE5030